MPSSPIRLAVVLGSVTPPGRTHGAVTDALGRLGDDVDVTVIDLADVAIAAADGRPLDQLDDDTPRVVGAIADADAVMLVSPTYRASMPGVLKNLLDQTPVDALKGKATAIVATGATAHHFLGVDRHLRDVLAFFGALVTPVSVYLMSNTDFVDGRAIPAAAADLDTGLQAVVELARLTEGRELGGPRPVPVR